MFCGNFNTGSKRDVEKCLKGMSDVPNWQCVTPAKTCRRHMCVNTTGITVCNDNDHDITLRCDTIVREMALNPAILCCTYGQGWKGISGQQFTNEGWNVIISYANCNHPTDERPSMGPPDEPWGPNGECKCC
ncbi:hypothetical protein B0H63DRAFT_221341 [Podospora didyma]|uniref:Uncharacterized protein n=1 Tax=Podospora didyma TaxID=330526 RepID=A0AAE0NBS1_9PEZI|nr:hypothetical protein B0H63DRAFT_221341 [Podospora didyma]